ncbi:hypothetical protein FJNA_20300 [Thermus sp. FJN-A]
MTFHPVAPQVPPETGPLPEEDPKRGASFLGQKQAKISPNGLLVSPLALPLVEDAAIGQENIPVPRLPPVHQEATLPYALPGPVVGEDLAPA